jgi:uncharacterized lipoprotein YmbA
MMDRLSHCLVPRILGFLLIVLCGCAGTAPTKFYLLNPLPGPERMANLGSERCLSIGIGPVKIPDYLDRSEVVTRMSPNELRVDEFRKWGEPLESNVSRVLAENLSSLLCLKTVAIFPWRGPIPIDYRVYVEVIRMDGALGESAFLDVTWAIVDGVDKKKLLFAKRSNYKEAVRGQDYEAFASAQSRNLEGLSRDIAAAIKGFLR